MGQDNTKSQEKVELREKLFELIQAHRKAFKQDRPFERAVWLLLSELFTFARHTVTQGLMTLGETKYDWSAWYRLFSHKRFDYDQLTEITLQEVVKESKAEEAFVVGVDGVLVPRSSKTMPGTSWWKALGTAPFRPGLARAQRFIHLCWFAKQDRGNSRAIPLRMLPAFPEKSAPAEEKTSKDWEAGLEGLKWVRKSLDNLGRKQQLILTLVDGGFERTAEFWKKMPEGIVLAGRSARNRVLYRFPADCARSGLPTSYGERAKKPAEWLKERKGWRTIYVEVRGKKREMTYRIEGPFLREGVLNHPVYLIVVRGIDRKVKGKRVKRDPAFFLVSSVQKEQAWVLPLPELELLGWLWQRWEMEVAHREMKTSFGLGEKQCWNKRSAVRSVQWTAWVYAILLLAGYRAWGLSKAPTVSTSWWRGSTRWSFNTLWRAYRTALWNISDFQPVCRLTTNNWLEKDAFLSAFRNSALGAARG